MDITDTKTGTCVTEYHSSYAHTVRLAHSRDDHHIISFMSLEYHVLSRQLRAKHKLHTSAKMRSLLDELS